MTNPTTQKNKNRSQYPVALLAILLAIAAASPIPAATVTNTSDAGTGSLRWAIDNTASGGTVDFDAAVSGATIRLTSQLAIAGKDLTIQGPAADSIAISGEKTCRVFLIDGSSSVTLSGLTVENGFAPLQGAGILSTGTLTMRSCTVRNCRIRSEGWYFSHIGNGSGIYSAPEPDNAFLLLDNCTITSNLLVTQTRLGDSGPYTYGAGACAQASEITIHNCEFSENVTINLGPDRRRADGVGLSLRSVSGTVERCTFRNNRAIALTDGADYAFGIALCVRYPGGISGDTFTIRNCRFTGNRPEEIGSPPGGPTLGLATFRGPTLIENCLLDANENQSIRAYDRVGDYRSTTFPVLEIRNTTISGNISDGSLLSASLELRNHTNQILTRLTHCTISGNTLTDDSSAVSFGGQDTVLNNTNVLQGNVIWNNAANTNASELGGGFRSAGYNIVGSVDGNTSSDVLDGPGDRIGIDPILGPLADNGGPTLTMMPLPESPLIDAIPPVQTFLTTDQRNARRPTGAGSDIGACETAANWMAAWSRLQRLHIDGTDTFWIGLWNYTSQGWTQSLQSDAPDTFDYYLAPDTITGLFLYDFTTGAFLDGMQIWHQVW